MKQRILRLLARKTQASGEIAGEIGVSLATMTQHAKELEGMGLVERTRVGRYVFVSLAPLGRELVPKP